MKLWHLDRVVHLGPPLYDAMHGFVIRARDEEAARRLANGFSADEGMRWTDPTFARCREISVEGQSEMILKDFNAS